MSSDEKINIEILGNRLEASGSKESVDAREKRFYEALKDLSRPAAATPAAPLPVKPKSNESHIKDGAIGPLKLNEKRRMVILRSLPVAASKDEKAKKATLVILLGLKKHFEEEEASVMRVGAALQESGLGKYKRLTPITDALTAENLIVKLGQRNGARLKLTALGEAQAEKELAALPQ